jgi:hypothetical protein
MNHPNFFNYINKNIYVGDIAAELSFAIKNIYFFLENIYFNLQAHVLNYLNK